jgi:Protein of unknown function with PCYCGC motif
MLRGSAVLVGMCCVAFSGFALLHAQNSPQNPAQNPPQHAAALSRVPPYHSEPPRGPLPATLDPKLFPDRLNQKVYAIAGKEKKILYQQPCYCGCDREVGHKSLLDCFCDRHASICAACKMEAVFAYQQYRKGKSAAQIRAEIIAGKWRSVDLSPYGDSAKAK